jgi:hypothetical protein
MNKLNLQSMFVIFLLSLCFYIRVFSQPIKLSEIKPPFNNDRYHIVRTLNNKKIVLFSDDLNNIYWTENDQGKNWSEPKELATGKNASLSIGLDNTIYAVWYENNSLKIAYYSEEEKRWIERSLVTHSPNEIINFPHFTVTKNMIYLTWTVYDILKKQYRLVYQKFNAQSLDPLSEIRQLCSDKSSIFPTIACDFKKNEPVVILYLISDTLKISNMGMHICFLYGTDSFSQFKIMDFPDVYYVFKEMLNLGVFNQKSDWHYRPGSDIIINFTMDKRDYFYFGEIKFDTTYSIVSMSLDSTNHSIAYTQPSMGPLLTATDSDFSFLSAAILVNNQNIIECIQNINSPFEFGFYYSRAPSALSNNNTSDRYFPKICTEFTQLDSCDGIWIEKQDTLYWLMYNRIPFQYPFYNYSSYIKNLDRSNLYLLNDFSLSKNYPNPFNSTTKVNYTLDRSGEIVIQLFNINGQQVKLIEKAYKSAGTYEIEINVSQLNSGVYLYQLITRDRVETKKLVLLK